LWSDLLPFSIRSSVIHHFYVSYIRSLRVCVCVCERARACALLHYNTGIGPKNELLPVRTYNILCVCVCVCALRKINVSKLRLIYYIVTADPPKLTPEIRTDNLLEIEFVRIRVYEQLIKIWNLIILNRETRMKKKHGGMVMIVRDPIKTYIIIICGVLKRNRVYRRSVRSEIYNM